jgi:SAM-dependent methyltransferase
MPDMNEIVEQLKADYDAVAYDSEAYPQSHPDRIAVVAALRGLQAPPVEKCRILEIGCASGGNLIPMSEQLPDCEFLGIDLSPRQIETGVRILNELGLKNIILRCQDLMEFPENSGTFDYIIAHGFYSWVPAPVRERLLRLCREYLAPNGLVYISYNTYPGWRLTEIARDMMMYHARNATNPPERVARGREIVKLVSEQTPETGPYHDITRHFNAANGNTSDSSLLHDQMEAINDPYYFWQFARDAKARGLAFVGEAGVREVTRFTVPQALQETICAITCDELEQEQYFDFLVNRSFRQSVLCLAEMVPAPTGRTMRPVRFMYIAGNPIEISKRTNGRGQEIVQFSVDHYAIELSDPESIAVLRHLRRAWPSSVSFSELIPVACAQSPAGQGVEGVQQSLAQAIHQWFDLGIVELRVRPTTRIAQMASLYPLATRFARWQAVNSLSVTSLRHRRVKMDDRLRNLLPLLDGSRDRQALTRELVKWNDSAGSTKSGWDTHDLQKLDQSIELALRVLATASVLVNN